MPALRTRLLIGLCCALLLPTGAFVLAQTGGGTPSRFFPETGHTVRGTFLAYWLAHGGVAQQGYPLSDELQDVSTHDHQTYTVQYFERAVFEWHPEHAGTPYEVLLSLLGVDEYARKYPQGAPAPRPNTDPGTILFPATGKRLGGSFREYWQANGGLAQQGYPISDEFTEVSALDGRSYTVQYFERAVFEWHPENKHTPYEVLLSQLGAYRYQATHAIPTIPFTPGHAQSGLVGSDSYLVWSEATVDTRGGVAGSADIRGLDLAARRPITVTAAPGDQGSPAIAGSTVVWLDDGPACPATCRYDIAGKDLATGRTFTVTSGPGVRSDLGIAGRGVTWLEHNPAGTHLLLRDLDTGLTTTVATAPPGAPGQLSHPRISAEYLVWFDLGVAPEPYSGGAPYTLRAYNRRTGQVQIVAQGVADSPADPTLSLAGHRVVWTAADLRFADIGAGALALLYPDYIQEPRLGGDWVVWNSGPGGIRGLHLPDRTPVTLVRPDFTYSAVQIVGDWLFWQQANGTDTGHYAVARLPDLFASPPTALPTPPPTEVPTLPAGAPLPMPTLIAVAVGGPPAGAGRYVFYTRPGVGATNLYRFDVEHGQAALVQAVAGGVRGLASDGQTLAWQEPGPAFAARIQGYDLTTGTAAPLLGPGSPAEPFGIPFALDAGVLYYESRAPGLGGIYAQPATGGGPHLIAAHGRRPFAADGALLWEEQQSLRTPMPGGPPPPAVCTLHLRSPATGTGDTVIARTSNIYGVCGFETYQVSGDNVLWRGANQGLGEPMRLYHITAGTTEALPIGNALGNPSAIGSPLIRGNLIAWSQASTPGSAASPDWAIRTYDLVTRRSAGALPPRGDIPSLVALLPNGLAFISIEAGPNTATLYFLSLEGMR